MPRSGAAVSATFVDAPAQEAALVRDVSRVAEVHGISHWESVDATWLGIGVGLRNAGMSEPQAVALVARVFGDVAAATPSFVSAYGRATCDQVRSPTGAAWSGAS